MPPDNHVHIIDGDRLVQADIEPLLQSAGFTTSFFATCTDFLNEAPQLRIGCILLDVAGPMRDSELQSAIRRLTFRLPVIVMIEHAMVQTAVNAMKAGAADFIEKPPDPEILLTALQAVLAKKRRQVDLQREAAEAVQRISSLSARERQVLDGLVSGHMNKQMAFELGLSVRTIEIHRVRMMKRLGVRQLSGAIRLLVIANSVPIDHV
jgi:two-component system response regulator FixJ